MERETKSTAFWLNTLEASITENGKVSEKGYFYSYPPVTGSQFPYVDYSDEMYEFWEYLETLGYAVPFQYTDWMNEFFKQHHPVKELEWLGVCDKDTLNKFMFCLRRQERFSEGLWAGWLADGNLLKLYKRIVEIDGI